MITNRPIIAELRLSLQRWVRDRCLTPRTLGQRDVY